MYGDGTEVSGGPLTERIPTVNLGAWFYTVYGNWVYAAETAWNSYTFNLWFRKMYSISILPNWDTSYHVYGVSKVSSTFKSFFDYAYQSSQTWAFTPTYLKVSGRCDRGGMLEAYDWVRVRRFVDPEPTHGNWGPAEAMGHGRDSGTGAASILYSTQWLMQNNDLDQVKSAFSEIYDMFNQQMSGQQPIYGHLKNYKGVLSGPLLSSEIGDCEANHEWSTVFYYGHMYLRSVTGT